MGSRVIIVAGVFIDDALKLAFARDDDVIEALATNRSDHPFAVAVLPRGAPGADHFIEPERRYALAKVVPVDAVLVPEQKSGAAFPRQRFDELLPGPLRGRMGRDADA